jgi:hypothetical protein
VTGVGGRRHGTPCVSSLLGRGFVGRHVGRSHVRGSIVLLGSGAVAGHEAGANLVDAGEGHVRVVRDGEHAVVPHVRAGIHGLVGPVDGGVVGGAHGVVGGHGRLRGDGVVRDGTRRRGHLRRRLE